MGRRINRRRPPVSTAAISGSMYGPSFDAYMDDSGTTRLVSSEEERELGRHILGETFQALNIMITPDTAVFADAVARHLYETSKDKAFAERYEALGLQKPARGRYAQRAPLLRKLFWEQTQVRFNSKKPSPMQALYTELSDLLEVDLCWENHNIDYRPKRTKKQEHLQETPRIFHEASGKLKRRFSVDALEDVERRLRGINSIAMQAKKDLAEANLRLVISIAKGYTNSRYTVLDAIGDGNHGLMTATGKFDYARGFKFSTYASWWIRQQVSRERMATSNTVRIPIHMLELIGNINKADREYRRLQATGDTHGMTRIEYICDIVGKDEEKVFQAMEVIGRAAGTVSLEAEISPDDEREHGSFIGDNGAEAMNTESGIEGMTDRSEVGRVLSSLTEREERVLRLRYGLDDGEFKSLEEIGALFGLTRERIRQIEAKAFGKLRTGQRRKMLEHLM